MSSLQLVDHLPSQPNAENLLDGFLNWALAAGIELYESQEEAVLEFFAGQHVILTENLWLAPQRILMPWPTQNAAGTQPPLRHWFPKNFLPCASSLEPTTWE